MPTLRKRRTRAQPRLRRSAVTRPGRWRAGPRAAVSGPRPRVQDDACPLPPRRAGTVRSAWTTRRAPAGHRRRARASGTRRAYTGRVAHAQGIPVGKQFARDSAFGVSNWQWRHWRLHGGRILSGVHPETAIFARCPPERSRGICTCRLGGRCRPLDSRRSLGVTRGFRMQTIWRAALSEVKNRPPARRCPPATAASVMISRQLDPARETCQISRNDTSRIGDPGEGRSAG